ncbi:cellulose synthase-like protein E6 [Typha latifolia]|uniref:cellulose synthase-like protein E6 n=1 Tax=Typha latifolia TaxID=4733 RepID=UPI003C2B4536
MRGASEESLFATEKAKGRIAYRLYASSMLVGISLIWLYRVTHMPGEGRGGKWLWVGLLGAELWYGFYWILTQSVRWNPIYRSTFKDKLSQRYEAKLPGVDIFVCTADPVAEPPSLVISTVLSVMAYNYPPEKLSVYLSDDGGSVLTFYALWEASQFAKHWLPFCKRYQVEPRSPSAYFSELDVSHGTCDSKGKDWSLMKDLYEGMVNRIGSVVILGKIPEEHKGKHKGFSEWDAKVSSRDHHPIVQVLIDGKEQTATDNDGERLPTLVYMAREKRPESHHNFKAGAMNALLRVSSVISNSPLILNVDCDMYSNNFDSIRDALCFFLDEEMGHSIGFVQYPQNCNNLTKNDLYGSSFNTVNQVEHHGLDSWGGTLYIGTGCFHRRDILCGRSYSKDYKEDWNKGVKRKAGESVQEVEEIAKSLATCTYEHNTQWGNEIGLKYGCPVEDVLTGLAIHCRGWKSIYFNPPRKGFLGVGPTTLEQALVQHKRWSEGNFQIFLSKNCPFLVGRGKFKLGLQMGYSIFGLWAPNSFPTLHYVVVPSLGLLHGISFFPKVTSPWFIPFAYVAIGKYTYSLIESLRCGDTLRGWWNLQRIWMIKRISSYLYATIEAWLKLLGVSKMAFAITTKTSSDDASKRYEQEMMEFGSSSSMFVIIATVALLNLLCLFGGLRRVAMDTRIVDQFLVQVILCGIIVAANIPIYEALFFRRDKGSLPSSITVVSLGFVLLACLIPIV